MVFAEFACWDFWLPVRFEMWNSLFCFSPQNPLCYAGDYPKHE